MIKLYEGGHFSGLLANGHGIKVGDELTCTGPYGVFTLRDSSPRRLVFIAGGAGMAPVMSLLRSMAEKGTRAPGDLLLRGAHRGRPLRARRARAALRDACPTCASSPRSPRRGRGTARPGSITDVVDRMEEDLTEVDAYLCGPPPMVDAAIALLERRGCPESRIYFDKFTTTAD